ncbi:MAG: tRNA-dihydrouridine synthase [Candidatus Cloacimonadota bacterium]|jgi:tRNA-dihydrouridine synthase B|nr:tRNA-dihydrouridine synthase [Candidatus Cloacimonadota bacterium]
MNLHKLIDGKIWLAPLAGYTDFAFRQICKKMGADVMVSEMVSADGLIYNYDRSISYAQFNDFQRPFGIQLFGSEAKTMAAAAQKILPLQPDFVDLNMGCPVKKVVKRGAGSALMQTPQKAAQITSSVKKVLEKVGIPLSVKFRAGWKEVTAIEFAQRMQASGADMLCLHARTQKQMFSGKADWQLIAAVKQKLQIPLIGNGDVVSAESAHQLFQTSGCDSVMIGRGIYGKPWLFREIKQKKLLSALQKLEIIKQHLQLAQEHASRPEAGIKEMRKHLAHYTKGLTGGSDFRNSINRITDKKIIVEKLENLFEENYE